MQIWNFSTGACLKELAAVSNQEITAIICLTVSCLLLPGLLCACCLLILVTMLASQAMGPCGVSLNSPGRLGNLIRLDVLRCWTNIIILNPPQAYRLLHPLYLQAWCPA